MERIKAALHIHDKTPVPGDGDVGNMQNPSSTGKHEPTATELWGAGNAETAHHHDHKGDTVAAAAAREAHGTSRPQGNADFINQTSSVQDDAFSRAQNAQYQTSSTNNSLGHNAVARDTMRSTLAEEKAGSSSTNQFADIEPRNEIEPSAETGPGSHFRPDTATGIGSSGINSTGVGSSGIGSSGLDSRGIGSSGISSTGGSATTTANRGPALGQEGHTVFHDAVTGRKPHGLHGESLGE